VEEFQNGKDTFSEINKCELQEQKNTAPKQIYNINKKNEKPIVYIISIKLM
jgi:hypothetical protein